MTDDDMEPARKKAKGNDTESKPNFPFSSKKATATKPKSNNLYDLLRNKKKEVSKEKKDDHLIISSAKEE